MEQRQLGRTDLRVSALCLGTMTWGEQNDETQAFAQLDRAKAAGVNFIDTAEMYPVPPRPETYATTERYIGNYLKARGGRADWIIASKIAGPGNGITHIRDGQLKMDRRHITAALDASLQRLQTDWIDLYQLHWPERNTNFFGQLGYRHRDEEFTPLEETLEALDEQIKAGKIRHVGLSNETPWGAMKFLQLAESRCWPRAVSIQNPYNLLNRSLLASSGLHPEPLQPAEPKLRGRAGRNRHARTMRIACLFATGVRHAEWQIRRRRTPCQRTDHAIQPVCPLQQPTGSDSMLALRCTGTRAWSRPGPDGPGLCDATTLRDQ